MNSHGDGARRAHPRAQTDVPELVPAIINCVAEVLAIAPDTVSLSSCLLDMGAQSLDFVNIVFRLERMYAVELPQRYLTPGDYSVAELTRAVASAVKSKSAAVGAGDADHPMI